MFSKPAVIDEGLVEQKVSGCEVQILVYATTQDKPCSFIILPKALQQ